MRSDAQNRRTLLEADSMKNKQTNKSKPATGIRFEFSVHISNAEAIRYIFNLLKDYTPDIELWPDTLEITYPSGARIEANENGTVWQNYQGEINIPTRLFATETGVGFTLGTEHIPLPFPGTSEELADLHRRLNQRDTAQQKDEMPAAGLATFPVHTGQEWQALQHLAGDGKAFDNRLFSLNQQRGSLRYQRPSAPFYGELLLTDEEREAGHGVDLLRDATRLLDVDSAVIWLYVSELLSPVGDLPANAAAFAWIDLDDVANKTLGGYASNPTEKQKRRAQVYHAIKYGARAFVGGARSIPYFDKQTGVEIPSRIYTAPWQISGLQESETPCLWPELDVPLRVRLVASPEWTALTTHRDAAQWLPLAEKIGAISGNQPGGAWARALALSYLTWCRIDPHAALAGQTPSRQKLLNTNTPKKQPYKELLGTKNANRIREYWETAESHLSDAGIIQLVRRPARISKSGSDEWRPAWLNALAPWQPGSEIQGALEAIIAKKYLEKPRQLNPAKRRGRPRKSAATA
jgi:hypothetical protein